MGLDHAEVLCATEPKHEDERCDLQNDSNSSVTAASNECAGHDSAAHDTPLVSSTLQEALPSTRPDDDGERLPAQPRAVATDCDVADVSPEVADTACEDELNEESEVSKPLMPKNKNEDCPTPVVVNVEAPPMERSWGRFVRDPARANRPRDAALALGRVSQGHHENQSSPFSYKSWILRLSRRRRLEIFIVLGLVVWLAFFLVLAIFMNGNASVDDDNDKPKVSDKNTIRKGRLPTFTVTSEIQHTSLANTTNSGITSLNATSDPEQTTAVKVNQSSAVYPVVMDDVHSTYATSSSVNQFSTSVTDIVHQGTNHATVQRTPKPSLATSSQDADTQTENTPTTQTPRASKEAGDLTTHSNGPYLNTRASSPSDISTSFPKDADTEHDDFYANRIAYSAADAINQLLNVNDKEPEYLIGVGRADITGPAADANMMGYANPNQVAGGIHMRQYARSFIIEQGRTRIVFVNVDACMGSVLVKLEVLKKLKEIYGDLYTAENLCISGTHTHSAPAGFLQDVLFQITSMGYLPETLDVMVDGIVQSIRTAHDELRPGHILINKGELLGSSINRSPAAYLNNPADERKRYPDNVDKEMILLKFVDKEGKGIGMINWFAVHCTSMNNTNSLISGDNKGYAELLFEQAMDPGSLPGTSSFVAAFAQSNEGDVSPNTRGPHCLDTGLPCDDIHSTCNGKVQNCIATGPGKDMFESTKIIGRNQFDKAMELYNHSTILLHGPVQALHQYVDMTNQTVAINSSHSARTCKPAMGFSFAAGTTDGPGAFNFKQGDKSGNKFWYFIRNSLRSPSQAQKDCHYPKPILLDTGEMNYPYPWQPAVVDTQVFRIGQFLISAVPGEFTTMSGRRLSQAVFETFAKSFPDQKFESVIAGLSNTYADYIATFEEYQVQRYEGASTIYGPHTLQAFIQQYEKLAQALTKGSTVSQDTQAHDIRDRLWSYLPGVVYDATWSISVSFGDVVVEAKDSYHVGESVSVEFVSGNPRNSQSNNITFLTVERELDDGSWRTVHTDSSWETKFMWKRTSTVAGKSEVTVVWDIEPSTPSGRYRIKHQGHYRTMFGRIYPYSGQSKIFEVLNGSKT